MLDVTSISLELMEMKGEKVGKTNCVIVQSL